MTNFIYIKEMILVSIEDNIIELMKEKISLQCFASDGTLHIQLFIDGSCIEDEEIPLEDLQIDK